MGGCVSTLCCFKCRCGYCARKCGCCQRQVDPDQWHQMDSPIKGLTRLLPKLNKHVEGCAAPFLGVLELRLGSFSTQASELRVVVNAVGDSQNKQGQPEALKAESFVFVVDRSDELLDIEVLSVGAMVDSSVGSTEIQIYQLATDASESEHWADGKQWNSLATELVAGDGTKQPIEFQFRYQFVRSTKDNGCSFGSGMLVADRGCCGGQGTANHWLCSHDNVWVVADEFRNSLESAALVSETEQQAIMQSYAGFADHEDEKVQLLARNTCRWLSQMHDRLERVRLESKQSSMGSLGIYTGEGGMGIVPTISCHLNYGGLGTLTKRTANKSVLMTIASSKHWQTASEIYEEAIATTGDVPSSRQVFDQLERKSMNGASHFTLYQGADATTDQDGALYKPMHRAYMDRPDLYNVRVFCPDDLTTGMGAMFLLNPGTKCVVFDCDGTLTTGDEEVVKQFFLSTVGMDDLYDPIMQPGASTCARLWAAKGFQCIYLSGRQGSYQQMSNQWLMSHAFPPGPVHLTRTSVPTMPVYPSVGVFKVEYLEELKAKGLHIYAAYGNTLTDIKAYENIGVPKERTFVVGPHGGKDGSVKIDFESHNASILTDHPDSEVPIPYTSMSWGPAVMGEDDTYSQRKLPGAFCQSCQIKYSNADPHLHQCASCQAPSSRRPSTVAPRSDVQVEMQQASRGTKSDEIVAAEDEPVAPGVVADEAEGQM